MNISKIEQMITGATASLVTVANELGQQETHFIPSDSFRRRMAVFFWENESGDPGLDCNLNGNLDVCRALGAAKFFFLGLLHHQTLKPVLAGKTLEFVNGHRVS